MDSPLSLDACECADCESDSDRLDNDAVDLCECADLDKPRPGTGFPRPARDPPRPEDDREFCPLRVRPGGTLRCPDESIELKCPLNVRR